MTASLVRRVLPAALCSFADFFGLSAVVPLIPFHLSGDGAELEAAVQWSGAINSIQYVGVVLGCIFWGYTSDRIGAMRTLRITIVGDVIFFAATTAVTKPQPLLVVRVLAGFFSPLVPAAAYIFEVTDAEEAVKATGANAFAIALGYGLGTACIGLYEVIGWVGVGSLASLVALLASLSTMPCCTAIPGGHDPSRSSQERAKPSGVAAALRSGNFLSQAASASALMFYFIGAQSILVIDLLERFEFSATRVSLVYVMAPSGYVVSILLAPTLTAKFGLQPLVTCGMAVVAGCCSLLAIPAVSTQLPVLLGLWALATLGFSFAILPAQARAKLIGVHQTTNGTGSITGTSRVIQSCGQVRES